LSARACHFATMRLRLRSSFVGSWSIHSTPSTSVPSVSKSWSWYYEMSL
jgi:hypothetical protein